ncbi:MAG: ABC transporter permease, partial [Desulfobacterales bacterium]
MHAATENTTGACELSFDRKAGDTLLVQLQGDWTIGQKLPSAEEVGKQVESDHAIRQIAFDVSALSEWDSGLLSFLSKIINQCNAKNITVNQQGLSEGIQKLLQLAFAVPERKGARKEAVRDPLLTRIGATTIAVGQASHETLGFIGESFLAFLKFFVGKARFQRSDLIMTIQQCGVQALPIVSLISLLVGLIFAFIGAVQLMMFGAQIFVAQIGTMQVNEEIDALQTLGISPMEFLVLPRMLALILMMPLLCIYADLMGILGGFIVGVSMLDISSTQYINQTIKAMNLYHFFIGIVHAIVFGVLVALAG